jgi:hypothetical protein
MLLEESALDARSVSVTRSVLSPIELSVADTTAASLVRAD